MAQIQGSSLTVAAGAHCGLLLTQAGHVYYWGKHRSVGEAVMRPQIVDALANNQHHVTHCAAGGATVICCTVLAQTVAWGQGPHGELGFGTSKKSSSKPDFVDALHGCRVLDLAAGYGHTVYVIGSQDAEDRKALEKLDEIEQDDVQDLMDAAQDKQDVDDAAPKKKAGKKRG
jgi:alpha-tubulin suppressor-like RCC1 family protein